MRQWIVFVALCIAFASAKITHRKVSADEEDHRDHILLEMPFGFDKNGHIDLTVSNIAVSSTKNNISFSKANFGFFIVQTSKADFITNDEIEGKCYLADEQHLFKIMDFQDWNQTEQVDGKNYLETKLMFEDYEGVLLPGEYMLFYADCEPEVALSFKIRIAFYNTDINGREDYLSVGERPLPALYMIMFIIFSCLSFAWAKECYKERRHVHGIHYLMFGLLVLRSVVYFTQAGMYHDDRLTGNPDGWNVAYYVFTFLRGVMFFVVIVLIGTGWSYLRPYIGENEKKILVVVIPLQIFANIAIIILDETSPAGSSFMTLMDLFHLVDIICCCAILFPIVWSIKHLREGSESDGKASANLEKLTLFRQFYVLVVVYIYFTRIIVYLLTSTLPYEYKWLSQLAEETATLIFYVVVGTKFRPHGENVYLKLDSGAAM